MILPRPIKKIIGILRGGVSPLMITLSVALGFWFGLIPGWSGIHTVILILVLILNVHIGIFLLTAALGKSFCLAIAPVMFHFGAWVQDSFSFLFNILASIPIIGMTDFSRYSVAAAVIVGPLIGLPCGLLLARSVSEFRRIWLKFEDGSDKFRKWHSKRWIRILDRLLIGKSVKDVRAVLTGKSKIVRKVGVVFAIFIVALSAVALLLTKNDRIKNYTARTLTNLNGAEVNLEKLDLSIFSAKVSACGIQFTDPEKPENNRIAIERLDANTSVFNLLLGRVVLDNIELSNVQFDQKRSTPGKIIKSESKPESKLFEPEKFKVVANDVEKLDYYLADAKKLKQWLKKISKWLPEGAEKKPTKKTKVPQRYLDYLNAQAPMSATHRILVKRIILDQVMIPFEQLGNSKILLTNISDAPQAARLPISIEIQSHETPSSIKFVSHYESPDKGAQISGTLTDIDLEKFQSQMTDKNSVVFSGGKASVKLDGTATSETIDLAMDVTIQDMQASSKGKGLFGLDPKVTSQAINVLKNMKTTIRLIGPIAEPRVALDSKALTEEFKSALVNAGKERLAREIDKQLGEQLGKYLPDHLPQETKDVIKKSFDGLGELLGGKKDKK